ncbi:MAG: hypothetical protein D6770_09730 [Anaerolineae bacterium]|nr:MAG: hypothetical protein D6770_09730 [Anaerolineae bacterium]
MKHAILLGLLLLLTFLVSPVYAQETAGGIAIVAPSEGEVIFGAVPIIGTTDVEGFLSMEIAFAFADDPATWFVIWSSDQPVRDGPLTTWDTTTLTDGRYTLRLRVFLEDGSTLETFVKDLRVQNTTPTETPTPTDTPPPTATVPLPSTPQPATLTPTPYPTPTPLPLNPATLTPDDFLLGLERGVLITLLSFLVIGLILRLRRH